MIHPSDAAKIAAEVVKAAVQGGWLRDVPVGTAFEAQTGDAIVALAKKIQEAG